MTAPILTATLLSVSGGSLAVRLALDPAPFAPSSGAVVALGAVLFTVIEVVGLMLVRGRWVRNLGLGLGAGFAAVGAVLEPDPWSLVAIATALGAAAVLAGRWLEGWLRGRPSATGPPPQSVLVLIGLLAVVPAVGLAAPAGLRTAHGVLGAAALFLAWAFSKAQVWSLWAIRLVLPVIGLFATVASPPGGAALLVVLVGGIVALSWLEPVRLSVQPLLDNPPGPRQVRRRGASEP
jgi:hypothetical protein